MKSVCMYSTPSIKGGSKGKINILYFLLTSANLSKSAWGESQLDGTQFMVKSWELGVLFVRSMFDKNEGEGGAASSFSLSPQHPVLGRMNAMPRVSKPAFVTDAADSSSSSNIFLPIPYKLPPTKYSATDVPWTWDELRQSRN
jgi:tyrosyl-DNA phosphodiesterase-1